MHLGKLNLMDGAGGVEHRSGDFGFHPTTIVSKKCGETK
jgi:hypothetical protein